MSAVAALAAATLGLSGCNAGMRHANPETVTLSFADSFSESHPIGAGAVQPFLEYLGEHGEPAGFEVRRFPPGAMGETKDHLTLMRSGVVDFGQVTPSGQPTQTPLTNVADLPGISDDACAAMDALLPMMQEGGILYEEEFKELGVRPLWVVPIIGYEIVTTAREVQHPSDVQGELLRSAGGISDRVLKELGAAPVAIHGSELYEAVSRGTVDGALLAPLSITQYGLEDVVHHATDGADLITLTTGFAISIDTWESLTPEQQEVIDEASAKVQQDGCEALAQADEDAQGDIAEAGVEVNEITPQQRQEWVDLTSPVREEWISVLEARGEPAQEVYDQFVRRLEEAQS